MNAPDQTLCLSQLAMAATQAKLGESHCQEAAARGVIIGLTEIPKIRLAEIHFREAGKFLAAALSRLNVQSPIVNDQSSIAPEPADPLPPTIADHIALAKQITGRASVPASLPENVNSTEARQDRKEETPSDSSRASRPSVESDQPFSSPEASQTHTEDSRPLNATPASAEAQEMRAAQGEDNLQPSTLRSSRASVEPKSEPQSAIINLQ